MPTAKVPGAFMLSNPVTFLSKVKPHTVLVFGFPCSTLLATHQSEDSDLRNITSALTGKALLSLIRGYSISGQERFTKHLLGWATSTGGSINS